MDRNQEALEDLLGTLRWALEIEWTDEQRAAIKPLCIQLAGDLKLRRLTNFMGRTPYKRGSYPRGGQGFCL